MWHAELMLNQLDRAEADFKALSQGFANIIEVGVMAGFSPKLLARAIRLANEQAPKMTIRLLTNFADGLLPGLIQGRYDLIVTHFDVRHLGGEDIDTDLLYYEHVEVIAAQGHPLSRRKQLEWKDLIGERWVLAPTQTSSRRLVDSQLLQRSKEKNLPTVEVMGFHYAVSLIHESGMLAAMPSRFARWLEEQGLAVRLPIVDRLAPLPVCVARLRSKETSAGAILFKNCLLQVCGDEDNVASVKKRRRAP
jgi:DNA-binding transcriptional LysR family regulator